MIWLVALIGSVTGFLFGYDEGIIAGSLDLVSQHFNFSHTAVGVMASALPFGALIGSMFIGAVIASHFTKYLGRRSILFLAGVLFLLTSIGTATAHVEWFFILSRLILGLAIGLAAVITPLYLGEIAPKELRGAVVAVYQLAITVGIFSAYSISYLLIEKQAWRMMFASSAIPSIILLIGVLFLPESPRWLVSSGRLDQAKKVLKRLRKKEPIEREFREIEKTLLNESNQKSWQSAFSKPLSPVLFLGIMLFCLQQLSGINVIIYFAPQIFKNIGFSNATGQILATLGIGLVNMLVTFLAIAWIDKIGRRKLLLFGFIGTGISLITLTLVSRYHSNLLIYFSLPCLLVYIFSFAISLGPIPHIAMSEIFPLHIKGIGMGMSSMSNWGFNTLTVFSFPLLQANCGLEITFALYGTICFLGFLYTLYAMPETKNLSLEEIESHLMSGQSLRYLGRKKLTVAASTVQI